MGSLITKGVLVVVSAKPVSGVGERPHLEGKGMKRCYVKEREERKEKFETSLKYPLGEGVRNVQRAVGILRTSVIMGRRLVSELLILEISGLVWSSYLRGDKPQISNLLPQQAG